MEGEGRNLNKRFDPLQKSEIRHMRNLRSEIISLEKSQIPPPPDISDIGDFTFKQKSET